MKDIHPQYYKEAKVKCVCGNSFTVGATKQKIEIEICSHCHPFYTGKQTLVDTAHRAEKFSARRRVAETRSSEVKARRAKAAPIKITEKKAKISRRKSV